ncbi:MAG: 50S ribosomal protein L19 [Dehalococcoidia bacterium]|nr:50S ribosomal protein L19 [Dehalococcoidia bacterium]
MDIREIVKPKVNEGIPQFSPGDTVKVSVRVREGERERVQHFQGMVIRIRRSVDGGRFTVRRVAYGVGVEYTLPYQSPLVESVEVIRRGKARRAKLYYMRDLSAKRARLKEKRSPASTTDKSEEAGE